MCSDGTAGQQGVSGERAAHQTRRLRCLQLRSDLPLPSRLIARPPSLLQAGPACPDADLSAAAAAPPAPYAPIVKCPNGQWPPSYSADDGAWDSGSRGGSGAGGRGAGLRPLLAQLAGAVPGAAGACLQRTLGAQQAVQQGAPLAWHHREALLAAVDGGDRVQLVDYAGALPLLGQGATGGPPPPPLRPALSLRHELQQQASALAWRPHGGKCLAVGAAHGVCLWHVGRPPAGSGARCAGNGTSVGWRLAVCVSYRVGWRLAGGSRRAQRQQCLLAARPA